MSLHGPELFNESRCVHLRWHFQHMSALKYANAAPSREIWNVYCAKCESRFLVPRSHK